MALISSDQTDSMSRHGQVEGRHHVELQLLISCATHCQGHSALIALECVVCHTYSQFVLQNKLHEALGKFHSSAVYWLGCVPLSRKRSKAVVLGRTKTSRKPWFSGSNSSARCSLRKGPIGWCDDGISTSASLGTIF